MSAHNVDERALVRSLRRGDEDAFRAVVNRHQATMVRVAQAHVRDTFVAEEIAQASNSCNTGATRTDWMRTSPDPGGAST
jgi:hypothetical protein